MLCHRISALNDPDQEQNDGDHKQNMDKPADRVHANHAEQPKQKQYDRDSYEHIGYVLTTKPATFPKLYDGPKAMKIG